MKTIVNFLSGIIIPIHHNHSNGNGDPKVLIATYIALNLICILIFLFRITLWLINDKRGSFFKEVFMDKEFSGTHINTMFFLAFNFIALIIFIASLIYNLI